MMSARFWKGLFVPWYNAVLTLLVLALLIVALPPLIDWAVLDAKLARDPAACRATFGACWGFIAEKHRLILFGPYPFEEQWRPLAATALFLLLIAASVQREMPRRVIVAAWLVGLVVMGILMRGGVFGLPYVESTRWGGLPLTLILSAGGLGLAFPLAMVLALGRRSKLPVIRALSVAYIELIRGVPLISVLFMASVMVPLFLPSGVSVDKIVRALVGILLFAAAYMAESIRGGLQSVPPGQEEAADALGLSYAHKMRRIVLPQALKVAIPSLTNNFISTFKDTSLVVIIGLFDLLGGLKAGLNDAPWRTFYIEGYLFVALIYFLFNIAMSRYSQTLERGTAAPAPASPRV
jgi:general L-amino acid transport system permease protein